MKLQIDGIIGMEHAIIDVKPQATFKEIKSQIMDQYGVPPCLQTLFFQGTELLDHNYLLNFKTDRLSLVQKNSCDGGGCMKIMVKKEDDKLIPLGVHSYDTLRHVKGKLEKKTGIKVDEQQILFKDEKLKNCKTLAEYDVLSMSTLLLIRRRTLKITVKMINGLVFTVDADTTDTVQKFKEKIADEEGFDIDEQRLIFQDDLLENDRQLRQYNLKDGSVVWLVRSIESATPAKRKCCSAKKEVKTQENSALETPKQYQIFVKTQRGQTFTFLVHGSMTMKDIKKMMLKKEGIPIENQRYVYGGKSVDDEGTLSSYQICKEHTIHLVAKVCGC